MRFDLDAIGNKGGVDVSRVRRISIQCLPIGDALSSAVVEVKRAFSDASPSVSFATTQTLDLNGSSITTIDVTDTAWIHFVCTTAEAGTAIGLEYDTYGSVNGEAVSEQYDLDNVGVRGTLGVSKRNRAFVLVEPRATNTAVLELKRSLGLSAVSFSPAINTTIDGATITEVDTTDTKLLVPVCTTAQSGQGVTVWAYIRDEVDDDHRPTLARVSLGSTTGSFTTTLTTLPFDRVDQSQSWLSNSSGVLTLDAGDYIVTADVTTDETTGNNRTEFESIAQSNATGSYVTVPGCVRRHYSRLSAQGAQSSSMTFALSLSESSSIRIQSRRASGTSTGEWIADGSSVTIQKI